MTRIVLTQRTSTLPIIIIHSNEVTISVGKVTFDANLENGRQIYLGIHDILTHYDTKKKAANAVKTAKHGVSLSQ